MHSIKLDGAEVLWYGHASFRITTPEKLVYVDPFVLPDSPDKADIILVTHEHFDHCNKENINLLKKDGTKVIASAGAVRNIGFGAAIQAGESIDLDGMKIHAVEAYNTNKFRSPGVPFHPKGFGVGFVVGAGGKMIYHAGDTDHIKDMSSLKNIDVALLPIGGTYTMTAAEAAQAANDIKPKILIPMHYNSDKYGVTGINADPDEVAKISGVKAEILKPLI